MTFSGNISTGKLVNKIKNNHHSGQQTPLSLSLDALLAAHNLKVTTGINTHHNDVFLLTS